MGATAAQKRGIPPATVRAELIVQNGRLKGTHRRLDAPVTCIGKSPRCDIRLNVDGISPTHCLITHSGNELALRDLDSASGTHVNGKRVAGCTLHDGDVIMVGPFHFQIAIHNEQSPSASNDGDETPAPDQGALRSQAAAVAAQQAALGEWEMRLGQREATLEKQQAQLGAHLEEKRQRLLELQAQTQATRQSLLRDRQEYEQHVEEVTADLGRAERDLLSRTQELEAEKKRLLELRQRLVHRARRIRKAQRQRLEQHAAQLDDAATHLERDHDRLSQKKSELTQNCLKYNTEVELGRRRLQQEWDRFHQEQSSVREHLRSRFAEIVEREGRVVEAEKLLDAERSRHSRRVEDLKFEASGLENRVRTGRRMLAEVHSQLESSRRAIEVQLVAGGQNMVAAQTAGLPLALLERIYPLAVPMPKAWRSENWLATPRHTRQPHVGGMEQALARQLRNAVTLAEDLADQRLSLLDHWRQLAHLQGRWELERHELVRQMTAVLTGLQDQAQTLLTREQLVAEAITEAQTRHRELLVLREHLVGWQGRLRAHELAVAAEQEQKLTSLAGRERALEEQLAALGELSRRWAEMGQQEVDIWRARQEACDKASAEFTALNQQRRDEVRQLEQQRRSLTTKTMALEQFRQECLARSGDAADAERRMQQLQRRWSIEETEALRLSKRECEGLESELVQIRARNEALKQQLDQFLAERQALTQGRTDLEQRRLALELAHTQFHAQMESASRQRDQMQRKLNEMQHEVDRIARELLEGLPAPAVLQGAVTEQEAPVILPLEKAA